MIQLGRMNTLDFMRAGRTTNKPPLAAHNDGGLTDGDKPKWGEGDGLPWRATLTAAVLHVSDALPSSEEMLNPWRLLPSSAISSMRRKVSRWVLKTSHSCKKRGVKKKKKRFKSDGKFEFCGWFGFWCGSSNRVDATLIQGGILQRSFTMLIPLVCLLTFPIIQISKF